MNCVHCKRDNPPNSLYCKYCGEKHQLLCRQCNTVLDTDNVFCHMCGLRVEEVTTPTDPATNPKFFKIRDGVLEKYTGKGLKSIVLPLGIERIGKKAFQESDVREITLSPSIKVIGDEAFVECRQLEKITLPEGLKVIGDCAFFLCTSLVSVTLPQSISRIESGAFSFCRLLEEINLPEELDHLGSHVFKSSESLLEVTIPKGISTLEEGVFSGCSSLRKLVIPASVTLIEESQEEDSVGIFHACQNLTIYGENDSVAEAVAQVEEIPFEPISQED